MMVQPHYQNGFRQVFPSSPTDYQPYGGGNGHSRKPVLQIQLCRELADFQSITFILPIGVESGILFLCIQGWLWFDHNVIPTNRQKGHLWLESLSYLGSESRKWLSQNRLRNG